MVQHSKPYLNNQIPNHPHIDTHSFTQLLVAALFVLGCLSANRIRRAENGASAFAIGMDIVGVGSAVGWLLVDGPTYKSRWIDAPSNTYNSYTYTSQHNTTQHSVDGPPLPPALRGGHVGDAPVPDAHCRRLLARGRAHGAHSFYMFLFLRWVFIYAWMFSF